jgi:hypothetical protein
VSVTFHGRDVFAPAAARLACGARLESLGTPISDPVQLQLRPPDGMRGEVLHVDAFGNLITNFTPETLPARYAVRVGDFRVPSAPYYAAVAAGSLLAIVGSAGLLELSARGTSAAVLTGARRGTPVVVEAL